MATPTASGLYTEVLTARQVCELYPFLNANTLRGLRHAGRGPASFAVNGRVLYRRAEVDRWLAEQEAATTRGGAA